MRPVVDCADGRLVISSPAVANGVVYVGSGDDKLYAFDAPGNTNCSGMPRICSPLWTAPTGAAVDSSPAVANGVVFVGSFDHHLYAFDAAGNLGCSGTPKSAVRFGRRPPARGPFVARGGRWNRLRGLLRLQRLCVRASLVSEATARTPPTHRRRPATEDMRPGPGAPTRAAGSGREGGMESSGENPRRSACPLTHRGSNYADRQRRTRYGACNTDMTNLREIGDWR